MTLSAAWTWRCRSWKISSSRPDSLALGHSVRVINTAAFCIIKRRLRDQNHTVHIFYNCLPLLQTTAGQKTYASLESLFLCSWATHTEKPAGVRQAPLATCHTPPAWRLDSMHKRHLHERKDAHTCFPPNSFHVGAVTNETLQDETGTWYQETLSRCHAL